MKSMVFISTLMIASSTSWVIVWATLELNTLVMCFLISKETKQVKDTINPAAMYFLIQAIASIVLVTTMVSKSSEWKTLLALMSLSLKMGVWPVHSWYLKLIPSLKFHSSSMTLIMTWQKIAPLILLSMLPSFNAIITLALLTMVLPLLSLSGPLGMKPLMATSSVSNSGWLLMCSVLSPLTLCMFFAQYSASVVMSLKFLNNNSSKEKTTPKNFIGSTIILGNMGGVPPLIMFTAKIMVIKNFLEKTSSTVLPVIMLISSCALLYFYCWALSEMIMLKPKKSQNPYTDTPWLAGVALVMSVPPLLLLILG